MCCISAQRYSSISGFRAAHEPKDFESGVNAKLVGKPETTAFRRYAQLGYFGVGNYLRFLLYSLTFVLVCFADILYD